jgi:CBS domain-containing protein
MQVNEAMTNDVKIASPNQSIRDAARLMAQIDAGVLPVGENDQLVRHDHRSRTSPSAPSASLERIAPRKH